MSRDPRMSDSALSRGPGQTIHYSAVFDGGKTPVFCGYHEQPCPATSEWRYVNCEACLWVRARQFCDSESSSGSHRRVEGAGDETLNVAFEKASSSFGRWSCGRCEVCAVRRRLVEMGARRVPEPTR